MSSLSLYIPSLGISQAECPLGNELATFDLLVNQKIGFVPHFSDRETNFATVDVEEANIHLRFAIDDLDKVRSEIESHLDFRGVDQVSISDVKNDTADETVEEKKKGRPSKK